MGTHCRQRLQPEAACREAEILQPGPNRFIVLAVLAYAVLASLWIVFSDRMLIAIADPEQAARLSSFKGLAFVLVTAVALAAALRYVASRSTSAFGPTAPRPAPPWPLLVVLGIVTVVLVAVAVLAYRSGSATIKDEELTELKTVGDLKATTISRWLDERRANARALARSPAMANSIAAWQTNDFPSERDSIRGALADMRSAYGFASAQLVDGNGNVLLTAGVPTLRGLRLTQAIDRAVESSDAAFVDLYPNEAGAGIRMAFVAPVARPRTGAPVSQSLIVLELDPNDFLYPLLRTWPTPERTGEIIMVRQEWNRALILNDLRDRPGSALTLALPLSHEGLPVARLLTGQDQDSGFEGMDDRSVRILAAGKPVPNTPWTVLAKIDEDEAFRPLGRLAIITAALAAAVLLLATAIAAFVWQRQQLQSALAEVDQRKQTAAAELRFQATLEQAPIGLAHLDLDGRWLRVNHRFWEIAGYDREALFALDPRVITDDGAYTLDTCIPRLLRGEVDRSTDERVHHRRDGTKLWLKLDLALVRGEKGAPQFFVLTIEDISDRKAAEIALQERLSLSEYMAKIAKTVPGIIYSYRLRPNGAISMPYAGPHLADIFGLEPGEVRKNASAIRARIHPDDRARMDTSVMRSAESLTMWEEQIRVLHPTKGERWIEARAAPEREADGSTIWYGFVRGITDRRNDEQQLRQAAAVFSNTQEGVVITDQETRILRVNPAVCAITGYGEEELVGNKMRMLQSGRHGRDFYATLWATLTAAGFWQGEIWNRRKNGEIYPELLTINAIKDATGAVVNYVGTFTDITRLKRTQDELEQLAHHDALTGLPNRLLLISRLDHALERARRHQGTGAVLFLDLDRFKMVNDSLGHPAGDELLILVTRRLRARLRDPDTLARLGGDEFVVVLEELHSPDQAAGIAQALIERLTEPFQLSGGQDVYIGASVGISLFPGDGDSAAQLIQQADTALYEAKEGGKGIYRFYRSALTEAANARLDLEARLRRGLERGELVLYYQPLVAIRDCRIVGVEALLRWQDPSSGLVEPDVFIPVAEETGLIVPLGDWVLREACRQMQAWRAAAVPIAFAAVNLSPRQFQLPNISEHIHGILKETCLPPECLEIEITEGALMHDGEDTLTKLAALKALGIRLAVDDFGTGYSSLSYLKRFPIAKLKVDKSFVRDIPADPAGTQITAAVIGLAKSLKLEVVAEGVETAAQLAFLAATGCDGAQGYLFAKPLPAADLAALVADGDRPWTRGAEAVPAKSGIGRG